MTQTEAIIARMKQLDDWYFEGLLTPEEYEARMTDYRVMLNGVEG